MDSVISKLDDQSYTAAQISAMPENLRELYELTFICPDEDCRRPAWFKKESHVGVKRRAHFGANHAPNCFYSTTGGQRIVDDPAAPEGTVAAGKIVIGASDGPESPNYVEVLPVIPGEVVDPDEWEVDPSGSGCKRVRAQFGNQNKTLRWLLNRLIHADNALNSRFLEQLVEYHYNDEVYTDVVKLACRKLRDEVLQVASLPRVYWGEILSVRKGAAGHLFLNTEFGVFILTEDFLEKNFSKYAWFKNNNLDLINDKFRGCYIVAVGFAYALTTGKPAVRINENIKYLIASYGS